MTKLAARAAEAAVEFLQKLAGPQIPDAAVVLGSGVSIFEHLQEQRTVSYREVFGVQSGVAGHAGTVSLGRLEDKLVVILRGRFHLYEGYDWDVVTLPARAIVHWGVPRLFLTNAAGGLNESFDVGDLMLITAYRDHLHPKFRQSGLIPALKVAAQSVSNSLTEHVLQASKRLNVEDPLCRALQVGTYAGLLGPNYETLTEIEMLKRLGCDAVGMSTVPELQACRGSNTLAAALSVITNVWKPTEIVGGHEEVLHAARQASQRLDSLLSRCIAGS